MSLKPLAERRAGGESEWEKDARTRINADWLAAGRLATTRTNMNTPCRSRAGGGQH
jgi:hypothetical protein